MTSHDIHSTATPIPIPMPKADVHPNHLDVHLHPVGMSTVDVVVFQVEAQLNTRWGTLLHAVRAVMLSCCDVGLTEQSHECCWFGLVWMVGIG